MSRTSARLLTGLCIVCTWALPLPRGLGGVSAQAPTSNPVLPRDAPFTVAVNKSTIEATPVLMHISHADPHYEVINGGVRDVAAGSAHAGTNAETQMLLILPSTPNIRMLLTVAEGLYRVVARKSAGISRPADLRGKKITTPRNTSAHYYLVRLLETAGLRESDVTIVDVPLTDMAAAVVEGRADAISMWEPEAQRAEDALGRDAVVFQNNAAYRELFSLYTSTTVLNDPTRRSQLVAVVRALLTHADEMRQKPSATISVVAAALMQPEALIGRSWKHHRFPVALPSDMLDVLVREEQWIANRQKRAPLGRAELSTFIDTSVLDEAKRGR